MRPKQTIVAALACLAGFPLVAEADEPCPSPSTAVRSDVRGAACPGDGFWGDWTDWQFCPAGTYVHSYHLRTERRQGGGDVSDGHDDTALNAVELQCVNRNGVSAPDPGGKLMPHPGWWGDWGEWAQCLGAGEPVVGVNLLLEGKQGGDDDEDDTAANALKFLCKNGGTIEAPYATDWGHWSGDWSTCPASPPDQAICGVQVRVEPRQGRDKDDTAMNGARFACCQFTCPGGTTDCGGQCIDTSSSAQSCGGCGKTCAAGQVCQGGSCVCRPGWMDCNGQCTGVSSDATHCGNCVRACAGGQTCQGGICR